MKHLKFMQASQSPSVKEIKSELKQLFKIFLQKNILIKN